MKKILFVVFIFLLNSFVLFSQKKKVQFWKISKEDLLMEYYEPDSFANAVVLYDMGIDSLVYKRHTIIKILRNEGKKFANIKIPLFNSKIGNFKAKTYNYQNGKIVETEIKKEDLIYEKTISELTTVKGAFPSIKKGSIIEIEYTILAYGNANNWYFQYDDIPVRYSEYSLYLSSNVNLHITEKGFDESALHFTKKKVYIKNQEKYLYHWYADTVPAFLYEKYITTSNDYKKRVEFELSDYNSGGISYNVTSSWDIIDRDLYYNPYFGEKIKNSFFLKNKTTKILETSSKKYEKMLKIYKFVQNELNWTGAKNMYSFRSYRKVFNKKEGNTSAEINLALISLLNSYGFTAMPVILSTRDNGKIFPIYPTIDKFNYVIASVKIDEKEYYLDATDKLLPAGLLPKRCYNGLVRQLYKLNGQLIYIKPTGKDKTISMYFLDLDENQINGSVQKSYIEYAAFDKRKEIEKVGSAKDYEKKFIKESTKENISYYKLKDVKDIYKPITEEYKLSSSDNITFAGDMIYLSPLLNEKIKENPFKLEKREYPVDYAYPISKKIIMQYTIPEGYEIVESPKNASYTLPEKAAQFQYSISIVGNKMQVISNFKINKTIYILDSYIALKNFYNLVIEKQKEQIVFKKKKL